jgi:hypothetical protein
LDEDDVVEVSPIVAWELDRAVRREVGLLLVDERDSAAAVDGEIENAVLAGERLSGIGRTVS